MTPLPTPTDEQKAICDTASGADSVVISAFAGTAKTTTLAMMGQRIKGPSLALAFNRRIAEELKPRFGGNFRVLTLNGLGHLAWCRALRGTNVTIEDRKLSRLMRQILKERQVELVEGQWFELKALVQEAMQRGLVPQGAGPEGLIKDEPDVWASLGTDLGIAEPEFFLDLAREILVENIRIARLGTISFDDQLYCSTMLGGAFPQYRMVLNDETQDYAPLNLVALRKVLHPSGRLVAVGDERQAIYAWRGAMGDAMARVQTLRKDWSKRQLTLTFRCPKVVVERQQGHAVGFRAHEKNRDGSFHRLTGLWSWRAVEALRPGEDSKIVVLCRNNAPLMGLAFKLIRARIGVFVVGRDISAGLIALTKNLAADDSVGVIEFARKLTDWLDHEVALAEANDRPDQADSVRDRGECLRAVMENTEVRTVGELRAMLEQLFAKTGGQVALSSIHRAKGLEWDLVLHLDPWRLPSRFAREAAQKGFPIALEQEMNLKYVAETRTKDVLVEADLSGFAD